MMKEQHIMSTDAKIYVDHDVNDPLPVDGKQAPQTKADEKTYLLESGTPDISQDTEKPKKKCWVNAKTWCGMGLFYLCLISIAFGQAAENVASPLWYEALKDDQDAFCILIIMVLIYPVVFFSFLIIYLTCTRNWIFYLKNFWGFRDHLMIMIIAFPNALNGVFTILASPASRTPPIIATLIGNSTALTVLLMNKAILCDRRNYFQLAPFVSVVFNFCSVYIAVIPSLTSGEKIQLRIFWFFMFFLGMNFGTLYNVLQKWYLERTINFPISQKSQIMTFLHLLAWQTLYLLIFVLIMFWLDIIPYFGNANGVKDFAGKFGHTFVCSFGLKEGCRNSIFFNAIFNGGYILVFWVTMYVNARDPSLTAFMNILCSGFVIIASYIYKPLNPDPEQTPLYFIIPAFCLSFLAIIIWERWDQGQMKKKKEEQEQQEQQINNENEEKKEGYEKEEKEEEEEIQKIPVERTTIIVEDGRMG